MMSSAVPPGSKRRSRQTTQTVPSRLISTEGSGEVRTPGTPCQVQVETCTDVFHVAPPSSKLNDRMPLAPLRPS
jgi:hypothetical protein